jgi:hypothetical protein
MDGATNTLLYQQPPYIESGASITPLFPLPLDTPPLPRGLRPNADPVTGNYSLVEPWNEFAGHYAKLAEIETNQALWPEGAVGPTREASGWAHAALGVLQAYSLIPSRVIATVEGGVAICFVEGDKYSDIECFNTGAVLGVTSSRRGRPFVWEIKPDTGGFARAADRIRAFLRSTAAAENAAERARRG